MIKVCDEYKPQESAGLKGYVVLSDSHGKKYVDKHNMILNEGRKVVMSKLFKDVPNRDESMTSYADYKLTKVLISNNSEESDYNGTINTYNTLNSKYFEITLGSGNDSACVADYDLSDLVAKYTINMTISITSEEYPVLAEMLTINSIGLVMENSSNGELLFSRIVFDPIPITTSAESFKLEYYIYF